MARQRRVINFSSQKLSVKSWRVRLIKLVLFSAPLLGAYFYSYTDYNSPLFCPIKALTGIPCPGCGMTRAFMAIASGNLGKAIGYNLFSPILFLVFLLTAIHLLLEVVTRRQLLGFYGKLIKNPALKLFGFFALLLYHVFRLYKLEQTGELALNFHNSPLGQILF
jgi:hypothetical protein